MGSSSRFQHDMHLQHVFLTTRPSSQAHTSKGPATHIISRPPPIPKPLSSTTSTIPPRPVPTRTDCHTSNTAQFRQVNIPPPGQYLTFREFESTYCTAISRNYATPEGFNTARKTWLQAFGLDVHPFNILGPTPSSMDRVESAWSSETVLSRRYFEQIAIVQKYNIHVTLEQIPAREPPKHASVATHRPNIANAHNIMPTLQPPRPALRDQINKMLANRAASDHELKRVMALVASGQATPQQSKKFQDTINELEKLEKSQQALAQAHQSGPFVSTPVGGAVEAFSFYGLERT